MLFDHRLTSFAVGKNILQCIFFNTHDHDLFVHSQNFSVMKSTVGNEVNWPCTFFCICTRFHQLSKHCTFVKFQELFVSNASGQSCMQTNCKLWYLEQKLYFVFCRFVCIEWILLNHCMLAMVVTSILVYIWSSVSADNWDCLLLFTSLWSDL